MVIVTRDGSLETTGNVDELSGPGFLCYRPEEVVPVPVSA